MNIETNTKCVLRSKVKGLTLLELILAMTIFSFILLAAAKVDIAAMHFGGKVDQEALLHNGLVYVMHLIEKDMQGAESVAVENGPLGIENITLKFRKADDMGQVTTVGYWIYPQSNLAHRGEMAGDQMSLGALMIVVTGGNQDILPNGFSLSSKLDSGSLPMHPFELTNNSQLLTVNLAAQKTLPSGGTIAHPGISKTILIRGGGS